VGERSSVIVIAVGKADPLSTVRVLGLDHIRPDFRNHPPRANDQ
jgi:hypothetical protein